jgi:hypothetical protein
VFIDLQNTRVVDALEDARLTYHDDVVKQIRVGRQVNARTRVVLDLQNAGRYSVYALYDPYRIVIDFERGAPPLSKPVMPQRASAPTLAARAAPPPHPAPPLRKTHEPLLLSSRSPAVGIASLPAVLVENDVSPIPDEHRAQARSEIAATSGRDRLRFTRTRARPRRRAASRRTS